MLQLSFLGAFLATSGETVIKDFESAKVRALLAYLMLESGKSHSREHLTALFWGDGDDVKSAKNMRQALSNLRKSIRDTDPENPFLIISSDAIQANKKNPFLQVDTQTFDTLIETCKEHPHRRLETCAACMQRLKQAALLYRGELLNGFTLKDAVIFQDWLVTRREYFHQKMISALEHLAMYHQIRHEYPEAISYARRLVSMDGWREESHLILMRLLFNAGQRSAALKQYQRCRRILLEEFGVEPQPETVRLYQEIMENQSPVGEPVAPQNNLPSFGTAFVGRQREILQAVEYLQTKDRRLVTLTGPGGVGKTRLALQVGQEQLYAFKDGVFWIPLDNIETAQDLPGMIANTIGMELPVKGDVQTNVLNFLRLRDILLIFDNYEHLLPETEFISKVLQRAAGASILVTSRESLHLQAEWVFELEGLPLHSDEVGQLPPAALLLEKRAQRIDPQFHISDTENHHDALRLCEALDGLPLGIELAGGMLREYTCAELAEQISQDIGVLTSSLRDIPERHRSLWVVFEYSWNLLAVEEKLAFAALGIFPFRFTTTTAAEICSVSSGTLSELSRKSLVRQVGKDAYSLHPLLRQYARKKLPSTAVDEEEVNTRFKAYCVDRAQAWEQGMKSERAQQALDDFASERLNLAACWNVALAEWDFGTLNLLVSPFFWFFEIRGKIHEGETLFISALDKLGSKLGNNPHTENFYYRLLTYYGWLSFRRGQTDIGIRSLRTVVEQGLNSLNIAEQAFAINHYGNILYETGQKEKAHKLHERAMRIYNKNRLPWEEALTCSHYGSMLSMDGDLDKAAHILQRGKDIAESGRFIWITAGILSNLAVLAYFQQDYQTAIDLFLQSNETSAQYGDMHRSPSVNHNNLAECYALLGELDRASQHLEQALNHFNECGNIVFLPYVYNTLATIRFQASQYPEARQALEMGIQIALENQMQAVINNLIADYAKYFLLTKNNKAAALLIHYVAHSPHSIKEAQDKAGQLIEEYGEPLRKEIAPLAGQSFTQKEILEIIKHRASDSLRASA